MNGVSPVPDHLHPAAGVKPWERPVQPEHPMVVEGGLVPGDTRLMAVCLFEELLRTGMSIRDLRSMSLDPNYQALHAIRATLGNEQTDELLAETAGRVGVHRFRIRESVETLTPAGLTIGATGGPCTGHVSNGKGS